MSTNEAPQRYARMYSSANGTDWVPMQVAKNCPLCEQDRTLEEYPAGETVCLACKPRLSQLVEKKKRRKKLEENLGAYLQSLAEGQAKEAAFVGKFHDEFVRAFGGIPAIALEMKRHMDAADVGSSTAINGWLGFLKLSAAIDAARKPTFDPKKLTTKQLYKLVSSVVAKVEGESDGDSSDNDEGDDGQDSGQPAAE